MSTIRLDSRPAPAADALPGRDWQVMPPDPPRSAGIARGLGISPLLAQLLLNRGVRDLAEGRRFLQPSLEGLHDPLRLPGMPVAVDRLRRAVERRERIVLYGDYDVDGIAGTALLCRALRLLGADVECFIPHRIEDGYGLHAGPIERLAAAGARVIVTVDCGTSDVEAVRRAKALGIDVIITDHHEPPETLPEPLALVNPKAPDSKYPGRELTGTGVAFKLATALLQASGAAARAGESFQRFLLEAMALTALGTVADVAPLIGENRIFAAYGLGAMRHCPNPGLRALIARCGIEDDEPIQAGHVGFRLGPRLNAGGRLGSALPSLRLFLSDDPAEAEAIADALEKRNGERQRVEARILEEARERIAKECDLGRDRAIVLADDRWHPGVIGIVASRLVETHHRPVFLIALADGRGRGSGRSIPGFPLHEALAACRTHLVACGGHAMAAGLVVDRDAVPRFHDAFLAAAAAGSGRTPPRPQLAVDAEVPVADLRLGVARELERLGPHGYGNACPVLAARDVRVAGEPKRMGRKGDHVSFRVAQNGAGLRAVWWGAADTLEQRLAGSRRCDVAFTVSVNAWMGAENVELIVKDLKAV